MDPSTGYAQIGLGVRTGTKAKRPQFVVVRAHESPRILQMLRWAKRHTPAGHRLIPYSPPHYNQWLKVVEAILGVRAGWTAHSPRAGFATESRARGKAFADVRDEGRWLCDSSLRVYLDVVGAAQIGVALSAAGLADAQAFAVQNITSYLSEGALAGVYACRPRVGAKSTGTGSRRTA